jgi:uncharacterized membrane protein
MQGTMKLRFWLVMLALALTPLAAPLLAATHPLAALLIRDVFSRLCHQDPSRSFVLEGSPVAVCVRCLGIYWGAAVAGMLCLGKAPRLLGLAMLLNGLDVVTGTLHWHGNLPLVRFLLGLLLGMGAGGLLFWPQRRTGSVLGREESA